MNFTIQTLRALQKLGQKFLIPRTINFESKACLKVRSWLKLRCKYCYFVNIRGRMFVLCTRNPRHKIMEPFDCKLLW